MKSAMVWPFAFRFPCRHLVFFLTILWGWGTAESVAVAQSPGGKAYNVNVTTSYGAEFGDAFFYDPDGSLLITQLGAGEWHELFRFPLLFSIHSAEATNGKVTLNYFAVTYPASGSSFRGLGMSNQGATYQLEGTSFSYRLPSPVVPRSTPYSDEP